MTANSVQFNITRTAQKHIKLAIKWKPQTVSAERAKTIIKETLTNFKNHLVALPNSGKKCRYLDIEYYREMTKGDYRMIYRVEHCGNRFVITLVMFCHVSMDYQRLLNQLPDFS